MLTPNEAAGSSRRAGLLEAPSVAKLTVHYESGEPDRVIEFDPREAPFQHDGEPGSLLDVILGHGLTLEHACGGNCACTTCHVIVTKGQRELRPSEENEDDLLDKAVGLTPNSRLGCQAVVLDPAAEIEITIPRYTVNIDSGSHGR